jgi:pimeloyl-ACP methyl ester carboxylesterase
VKSPDKLETLPLVARHKLIFVPGIMGSELYAEVPTFGQTTLDPIWARDESIFWATLSRRPKMLWSSRPLVVGNVIRRIGDKSFYGDFLAFLEEKLGYIEGQDLFPFAYDWRQSNMHSAKKLAERILSITSERTRDLILVGHSMGGMIIRLVLGYPDFKEAAARVCKAILIASPGRGSSNAFRTLQARPDLGFWVDQVLTAKHWIQPQLQNDLMQAMRSFDSLLELLPPDSEQILVNEEAFHWSALDERVWPPYIHEKFKSVRLVQEVIRAKQSGSVIAIFSSGQSTDHEYFVDEIFQFKGISKRVKGDNRVSPASAVEGIEPTNCHRLEKQIPHGGIPDSPECCKVLETLLRQ